MQLGRFCSVKNCDECPIYETWKNTGIFHEDCMQNLRFPDVAEKMDRAIKNL